VSKKADKNFLFNMNKFIISGEINK